MRTKHWTPDRIRLPGHHTGDEADSDQGSGGLARARGVADSLSGLPDGYALSVSDCLPAESPVGRRSRPADASAHSGDTRTTEGYAEC